MAKKRQKKSNPARMQSAAGFTYNDRLGLFLPNRLNAMLAEQRR